MFLYCLLGVDSMYTPKYFKESEFTRCTPACKLSDMDEVLLWQLDKARDLAGVPFVINSAYRSESYEKSKGRNGTSSHCKGYAVDLRCKSSHIRSKMLCALVEAGFKRIGIYPTFLHVDVDPYKVSAIWLSEKDITNGG